MKKSYLILGLFWLFARVSILFIIGRLSPPTDIEIYFKYASDMFAGLLPYRDFTMEYPPGVLPFILLPRLFADNPYTYQLVFMIEMMIIDGLGLGLLMWINDRHLRLPDRQAVFLLETYIALPVILAVVAFTRFDFVPAFFTLLAVAGYFQGNRWLTWLGISLGVLVKLYPAVLAPVILLFALRRGDWRREIAAGATVAILATALVWGPFIWVAGGDFWQFFLYHGGRGLQLESIYASGLLTAKFFGLPVGKVFNYGSWHISSPYAGSLAKASFLLMLILLLAVYFVIWRRIKQAPVQQLPLLLPHMMLLPLLAFLVTGKVLSPQFMVWLLPFIPFLGIVRPRPGILWYIAMALFFMTFLVFPCYYLALLKYKPVAVAVLLARNLILGLLFYLVLKNDNLAMRQDINTMAM